MQKYMEFGDEVKVQTPTDNNWQRIRHRILNKDEKMVKFFTDTVEKAIDPDIRNTYTSANSQIQKSPEQRKAPRRRF